jgi:hypothetical protein
MAVALVRSRAVHVARQNCQRVCVGPGCKGIAPRALITVQPPTIEGTGLTESEIARS